MKNVMRVLAVLALLVTVPAWSQVEAYEYMGIDIRGFVSQGYLKSSDNNFFADTEDGTTQFDEAAINFSANVSDRLRIGLQLLARDLGSVGNNEVVLDWAVADYRWRDELGIMAGNMKLVMGLYNETRDLDMLRTFIFLPQSVYNEGWRDSSSSIQGAGLYGDIPLSSLGTLSYDAQYGAVNMSDDKGADRLLEDQWPLAGIGLTVDVNDIDVDQTYAGSLKWITSLEGLVLGVSGWGYSFSADGTTILDTTALDTTNPAVSAIFGVLDQFGTQLTVPESRFDLDVYSFTGSVEYTWRNLVFAAEYMQTRYDIEMSNELFAQGAVFRDAIVAAGADVDASGRIKVPKFTSEGYYASLTYRFTPWFELGTYYSVYYPDKDDKNGDKRVNVRGIDTEKYRAWLKDTCVTARFDITPNWILKLEGHKMDGAAILLGADNPPPSDPAQPRYEEDWYLYAAKVTYSF
ncbi:MAG TPA: hypothetical protein PKM41_07540 [Deltaproteobacteria bacterium]|jgi:hypothetical protein|nr:hypothetical protein [Deltaproteobacteria bacterium]HOI06934.1 hypothetical protein [Deltaproteobacteria bacterium]